MRSMTFSTEHQEPGPGRAFPATITALVHALIIAGLAFGLARHDTLPRGGQFTVPVFMLAPVLRGSGAGAGAPLPASSPMRVGATAGAVPVGTAQAGRAAPTVAAPVEVALMTPRRQEAVPQPATTAESMAENADSAQVAANAAPPAQPRQSAARTALPARPGAVRMVPVRQSGADGAPHTIILESLGSSVGTYTFPALAGVDEHQQTELFRVELGNYPDIETAMVNHVIAQIRARFPDEINWESRERGGVVKLSMRVEDHDELVKFLRIEMFGRHRATTY